MLLTVAAGCGQVGAVVDAHLSSEDAPPEVQPKTCNSGARFGPRLPIPGLEVIEGVAPRLSPDERTIYFGSNAGELYAAERDSPSTPFRPAIALTRQNSISYEGGPTVTADGLALWFSSVRVPNEGTHIYVSTRTSMLAEFGTPGLAANINSADVMQNDQQVFVIPDGSELWFTSTRAGGLGGRDILQATRVGDHFSEPRFVLELNSPEEDWLPTLSSDRLTVYFSSVRSAAGTKGSFDVWTAHRSISSDGFPTPSLVDELSTSGSDLTGWLSADNCRIYGATEGSDGLYHPYVASRL